jgi:hypothetical protein
MARKLYTRFVVMLLAVIGGVTFTLSCWVAPVAAANCTSKVGKIKASSPNSSGQRPTNFDGTVATYKTIAPSTGANGKAVGLQRTCPPVESTSKVGKTIVRYATDIMNGKPEPGWRGGAVPYAWGGGHKAKVGPSLGTCAGYTGSIKPCPARTTTGVDCSGFARWVYKLAYGKDILGPTNSAGQIALLKKVSSPQPGDLVFYGRNAKHVHHVGIYIGKGKMINARKTGTYIRVDKVSSMSDLVGYYRYQ